MELRHLQHFVAVAEDQHFTRAAERLLVSQSGLSASIRALERELQTPLFVRTTRRVTLTPAGRALLGEAERILAQVRSITTKRLQTTEIDNRVAHHAPRQWRQFQWNALYSPSDQG